MKNDSAPHIERHGFGLKGKVRPVLEENYKSSLIEKIKASDYNLTLGRLELYLAREFGFCYGVDRAVDFAYETRAKFPDREIYITGEIIHNPMVNQKLLEMGIRFLSGKDKGSYSMDKLKEGDIVLLPAFGASVQELEKLREKQCLMVDTTCGSVIAVWRRVEQYEREGFTAIIHGKYDHEETKATASRAGKYLVIRDKNEAELVWKYILNGGKSEEFMQRFGHAVSPGFHPDADLEKVGCANQTTMLSTESLEIANRTQEVMSEKFGADTMKEHFRHFDTICSATQDRQDAMLRLTSEKKLDLALVVGGFNSSNTTHLLEIAMDRKIPAFHVKDAECLISIDEIEHQPLHALSTIRTTDWLKSGPLKVGITGGASTPDRLLEDVIMRLDELANQI